MQHMLMKIFPHATSLLVGFFEPDKDPEMKNSKAEKVDTEKKDKLREKRELYPVMQKEVSQGCSCYPVFSTSRGLKGCCDEARGPSFIQSNALQLLQLTGDFLQQIQCPCFFIISENRYCGKEHQSSAFNSKPNSNPYQLKNRERELKTVSNQIYTAVSRSATLTLITEGGPPVKLVWLQSTEAVIETICNCKIS